MAKNIFISLFILMFASLACNTILTPLEPLQAPTATAIIEPTSVLRTDPSDLPKTEASVPRVSAEEAKAALDSGAAIIVDVRDADSYATEHIAGAISIPLEDIELNPTTAYKNKNQWIITYCT